MTCVAVVLTCAAMMCVRGDDVRALRAYLLVLLLHCFGRSLHFLLEFLPGDPRGLDDRLLELFLLLRGRDGGCFDRLARLLRLFRGGPGSSLGGFSRLFNGLLEALFDLSVEMSSTMRELVLT